MNRERVLNVQISKVKFYIALISFFLSVVCFILIQLYEFEIINLPFIIYLVSGIINNILMGTGIIVFFKNLELNWVEK